MSDSVALPSELIAVRDACGRILKKLKDGMGTSEKPAGPFGDHEPFDIVDSGILSTQLTRLQDGVFHLVSAIEELGEAMEIGEYDNSTVYSIMGRVEAHVEILQAECVVVGAWRVSGEDLVARDLMTAIYRRTLNEIRLWLEEVVAGLADPISALEKRGIGLAEQVETLKWVTEPAPTSVQIPFTLELTGAPELSDLTAWMERRAGRKVAQLERQEGEQVRRERDSVGIGSVLFAVLFGWWLGGWGDDE